MRHRLITKTPETYAIVFESGDELAKGLKDFAAEQELTAASFKAIGALSSVELGWFDWDDKEYHTSVKLDEQVELLSLIGDIALKDDKPAVHAHIVVGKRDGTAHGGHLIKATVRPTCEVILTVSPAHLIKHIDPESGIALIRPYP
jgi:predicted DNA-binding protein with PD1-like motif